MFFLYSLVTLTCTICSATCIYLVFFKEKYEKFSKHTRQYVVTTSTSEISTHIAPQELTKTLEDARVPSRGEISEVKLLPPAEPNQGSESSSTHVDSETLSEARGADLAHPTTQEVLDSESLGSGLVEDEKEGRKRASQEDRQIEHDFMKQRSNRARRSDRGSIRKMVEDSEHSTAKSDALTTARWEMVLGSLRDEATCDIQVLHAREQLRRAQAKHSSSQFAHLSAILQEQSFSAQLAVLQQQQPPQQRQKQRDLLHMRPSSQMQNGNTGGSSTITAIPPERDAEPSKWYGKLFTATGISQSTEATAEGVISPHLRVGEGSSPQESYQKSQSQSIQAASKVIKSLLLQVRDKVSTTGKIMADNEKDVNHLAGQLEDFEEQALQRRVEKLDHLLSVSMQSKEDRKALACLHAERGSARESRADRGSFQNPGFPYEGGQSNLATYRQRSGNLDKEVAAALAAVGGLSRQGSKPLSPEVSFADYPAIKSVPIEILEGSGLQPMHVKVNDAAALAAVAATGGLSRQGSKQVTSEVSFSEYLPIKLSEGPDGSGPQATRVKCQQEGEHCRKASLPVASELQKLHELTSQAKGRGPHPLMESVSVPLKVMIPQFPLAEQSSSGVSPTPGTPNMGGVLTLMQSVVGSWQHQPKLSGAAPYMCGHERTFLRHAATDAHLLTPGAKFSCALNLNRIVFRYKRARHLPKPKKPLQGLLQNEIPDTDPESDSDDGSAPLRKQVITSGMSPEGALVLCTLQVDHSGLYEESLTRNWRLSNETTIVEDITFVLGYHKTEYRWQNIFTRIPATIKERNSVQERRLSHK
mmetsp:Transcript_7503/g.10161  ORF Transcript_7503/g.10161 Transcript_7503/m.10161 type:complete len:815 (-) Transcript_7503:345-2789(-)